MRVIVIATASIMLATPAFAQSKPEGSTHDTLSIAVGPAVAPRYEGSNDYRIIPAAAIRGKVSGIAFSTLGTGLFVNLIASPDGVGTKFVFGPVAHVTLNRSSRETTRDLQVIALGRVKVAAELGAHVGLSRTGVITSDYDNLTIDVTVTHDVTGIHDSLIVTPSISYGTPLSRKAFVGLSVSANHVGSRYARTYFGVTPAQATASGFAVATPGTGFKDVNVGTIANYALTGDLRHGLSAFVIGSYARLLGDIARSPIVRSRDQWFGGLGLAYTF